MLITDIIAKKRDGLELNSKELEFVANSAAKGTVPDYQLSALLMAIYLNSMNEREITDLTLAMAKSGDMLDLSPLGEHTADKHSTGGVGDKTTLISAPIAAALGCTVAKMSGRGLGHTGGTVDKLESIDGFKTSVSSDDFIKIARKTGLCMAGQSGNFAPADKKLYALRDVTATVECIPLIASSIMSKKLVSGAKTIVLDVKYGNGAFMKTPEKAVELAEAMVKIGKNAGRNIAAVITDMDIPLGRSIGNSLEVIEAVEILKGKGDKRLRELSVYLASYMYSLSFGEDIDVARQKAEKILADGSAFNKLIDTVSAQGGDTRLLTGERKFETSKYSFEIKAPRSGYISRLDSLILGKSAGILGAGRETLDSKIDFSAGIKLEYRYGEYVKEGETLAVAYSNKEKIETAKEYLASAFDFSEQKPEERPLIFKVIV